MAQTVARNRQDLERALSTITSELLKGKGYLCFVDVFIKLGYLSKSDYEHWRFKRVSPLERVLSVNLSRINFIMKTVRRNSINGHLKPSMTVYTSWGQGKKTLLQFSKSGDPRIETAYATHFVKPKRVDTASACTPLDKRSGRNRHSFFSVDPTEWTKDSRDERQNRTK